MSEGFEIWGEKKLHAENITPQIQKIYATTKNKSFIKFVFSRLYITVIPIFVIIV